MAPWISVIIIMKAEAIVASRKNKVAVSYLLLFYVKYQKRASLLSYNL